METKTQEALELLRKVVELLTEEEQEQEPEETPEEALLKEGQKILAPIWDYTESVLSREEFQRSYEWVAGRGDHTNWFIIYWDDKDKELTIEECPFYLKLPVSHFGYYKKREDASWILQKFLPELKEFVELHGGKLPNA